MDGKQFTFRKRPVRIRVSDFTGNTGDANGNSGNSSTKRSGNVNDSNANSRNGNASSGFTLGNAFGSDAEVGADGTTLSSVGTVGSSGGSNEYGTTDATGTGDTGSNSDSSGSGETGKRRRRTRKLGTGGKKSQVGLALDQTEIRELITALYDGAAQFTQFEGFRVDEQSANSIARPAARILARHPEWAEAITKVSDPVSLVVAVVTVTAPKIMAYNMYKQYCEQLAQQPNPNPTVSNTVPPSAQQGHHQNTNGGFNGTLLDLQRRFEAS